MSEQEGEYARETEREKERERERERAWKVKLLKLSDVSDIRAAL